MELNLSEVKSLLLYIIKNNRSLQDRGQYPITVSLESTAGIGKTSLCDQIASELDCNYVKINLSQLSDPSDLVGWPLKEHYVCNDEKGCEWISAELIPTYVQLGYKLTPETRMSYAIPAWVKSLDPSKSSIVVLDDWSRVTPAIAQAAMEIVCRQEYISWKLPKYTTIIMTENPNDGSYNVSDMDEAMLSRYMKFRVKFDINSWSEWAERAQIDGRAINFLLQNYYELMNENEQHKHPVNARNYVMFANAISGISNWDNPTNLALINQIASGAFVDDKDNIIGGLFTTFIANKLDKLISPEDLLLKSWDSIKDKLIECVYTSNGVYRPDVAAILHTRLLNYSAYYFEQPKAKTDIVQDRLLKLIECNDNPDEKMIFSEDFLFDIIRNLIKKFPNRTNKFMLNPKIRNKVL